MELVVNNFYVLEKSGEPILTFERNLDTLNIENDTIFQDALSRVAKNLGDRVMNIGYKDFDHYIKNIADRIVVMGIDSNPSTKPYIKSYLESFLKNKHLRNLISGKNWDNVESKVLVDNVMSLLKVHFEKLESESETFNFQPLRASV